MNVEFYFSGRTEYSVQSHCSGFSIFEPEINITSMLLINVFLLFNDYFFPSPNPSFSKSEEKPVGDQSLL